MAGAVVAGMAAPAGASHSGGISETCPEVQTAQPGHLEKVTKPPHGAVVQAGQVVEVRLLWDPGHFTGTSLHKVLDCVRIDGALAEDLSVQERDTANDGEFVYTFAVPTGLAPGSDLCDQGFVSGDAPGGGFERETSNDVCFEVGQPPVAPTEVLPQIGVPATEVRPEQPVLPASLGDDSQAVERDHQGPTTQPLLILDTLPRTGSGRLLLVCAGITLAAGGAAFTLSVPRRRTRRM
jgi:hypothetical protein